MHWREKVFYSRRKENQVCSKSFLGFSLGFIQKFFFIPILDLSFLEVISQGEYFVLFFVLYVLHLKMFSSSLRMNLAVNKYSNIQSYC